MRALAVILEQPGQIALRDLPLDPAGDEDVVVDMDWSGISTGTERLLWSGRMPAFPGMGYPLVPGYESAGRVSCAGAKSGRREGDLVFVPGARCYGSVRGLFGGAASRVVVPGARVLPVHDALGEKSVLIALAATAHHIVKTARAGHIDLIVGHGVLGRLLARICVALDPARAPLVWETDADRRDGALGYEVIAPSASAGAKYRTICDVSGDSSLLDTLIAHLAPQGEIVLGGFYERPVSFAFPPAFMREARLAIAAQWQPEDLAAASDLIAQGRLSLDGLITHRRDAADAGDAYATAFNDASCLKMVLDWRSCR